MIKSFLFFIKDNLSFFQHDVLQSVLNFVGLLKSARSSAIVPSCLHGYFAGSKYFLVSILWVQTIFSRAFHGSKIFSRGYFVGYNFFLVGFLCVKSFSSWAIRWSKIFSHGYFVGQCVFLTCISWGQSFFAWVQNLLSWFILEFSVVGSMRKSGRGIYLKLRILFQIDFNNFEFSLH